MLQHCLDKPKETDGRCNLADFPILHIFSYAYTSWRDEISKGI